jgi:hypothetical protein
MPLHRGPAGSAATGPVSWHLRKSGSRALSAAVSGTPATRAQTPAAVVSILGPGPAAEAAGASPERLGAVARE